MSRATRALIDLAALRHNLGRVREAAPGSKVMAIVKADAYGHGLVNVAGALAGVDAFGVARIEEAFALREAGVAGRIVLLEGVFRSEELEACARLGLEPVVHHMEQIAMLAQVSLARPLAVWLKIDTGMHRLGFSPERGREAWERLRTLPAVAEVRLMTHLAYADDRSHAGTARQLALFEAAVTGLGAERAIANSGGILGWRDSHGEWVRPGIMLYGVSPFCDANGGDDDLEPVMTLQAPLIALHAFKKGDALGYGGAWVCPEDMRVGVVAAGYGDGYPRHAAQGTPVLLNGRHVPLIGRVSMDMIMVDLRGQPEARIGDMAVLWGRGLPVEEVARHASTIPYDLLCGVSGRVERTEAARHAPAWTDGQAEVSV